MDKSLEIEKVYARARKKFAAGANAYQDGFPAPSPDTPERYGWEAMEQMTKIKKQAMQDMYESLEAEISDILEQE
jgi:hypothetical protein